MVGKTGKQWDQTTKEPKTPNRKTMALHLTSWYINKAEGRKGHETGIMGDFKKKNTTASHRECVAVELSLILPRLSLFGL